MEWTPHLPWKNQFDLKESCKREKNHFPFCNSIFQTIGTFQLNSHLVSRKQTTGSTESCRDDSNNLCVSKSLYDLRLPRTLSVVFLVVSLMGSGWQLSYYMDLEAQVKWLFRPQREPELRLPMSSKARQPIFGNVLLRKMMKHIIPLLIFSQISPLNFFRQYNTSILSAF